MQTDNRNKHNVVVEDYCTITGSCCEILIATYYNLSRFKSFFELLCYKINK